MSGIVVGVEADEIAMQYTQKKCLSHRKNSVYLAAREWGVQEEANLDILLARAYLLS